MVTGHGTIDGRRSACSARTSPSFGGSLGEVMGEKMCKVMDLAAKIGCPVIGINDSGGARIQEGVVSLGSYGDIFLRNVRCSGVIPQIQPDHGPVRRRRRVLARRSPTSSSWSTRPAHMFITGPDVIKTVTGEEVDFEELGGAMTHNTKSGVAHFASEDEDACLEDCPLPAQLPAAEQPRDARRACSRPTTRTAHGPGARPRRPRQPQQALRHARRRRLIVDDGEFFEVHAHFATNIICGFARLDGDPGGDRRQPAAASWPACSTSTPRRRPPASCAPATPSTSRSSPSSTCPGFLPGTGQEWGGIIRRGAKLLYAYAEATVPKLTVITRKAYGGAYDVMGSKHLARTSTSPGRPPRSP